MSDWSKVENALKEFFSVSTGIPFFWDCKQFRKLPFGTLSLESSSSPADDQGNYEFNNSGGVTLSISGTRRLSVEVAVFSERVPAQSILEKARLSFAHPERAKLITEAQMQWIENTPIQNISLPGQRYWRSQMSSVFYLEVLHQETDASPEFFDKIDLGEAA